MPQLKQFNLPDAGEGLTEAEILRWLVKPGDKVSDGQVIVEVETAKAAVELPCPFDGVVTELLAEVGATVEVGAAIITVDVDSDGAGSDDEESPALLVGYGPKAGASKRRQRKTSAQVTPSDSGESSVPEDGASSAIGAKSPAVLAKPPIRKLAKDLGVDLTAVPASGPEGTVTRDDIHAAVSAPTSSGGEQRIPIKGVRKATADAMVASAFTAPHVSEFLAIDITPTMELRSRLAASREFAGMKLSPLVFVAKAMLLAARRHPMVNSTWDAEHGEIVVKDHVNLGIAAATERGLIVPNIKDAQRLSLHELAVALASLTETARAGKTSPPDMAGGTMSITNVGVFGIDTGTPILPPGETAILAVGAVRERPWVVDGAVVPRQVTTLALSFDHRIVDGQLGAEFLSDIGAMLSDPGTVVAFA